MPGNFLEIMPDPEARQANILIVDDLSENHLIYKTILEELGQNLVFAASGEEALKQVLLHEFAVILLDVNMSGMSGFETASYIRSRKKSARTPIIFLTAFTDEMHAAQGYASGAVDYLPTPVVPETLRAKVRIFIELYQVRQQVIFQAEERTRRVSAEESMRRSDFLVTASESLTRAQNPQEVLEILARLPIPFLADASIAVFSRGPSEPEHVVWSWKGEDKRNGPPPLEALLTSLPWLKKAINEAVISGQHTLLNALPPPIAAAGQLALFSTPDLYSALVLPLIIKSRVRGVLVLARERGAAAYQDGDLSLGRALIGCVEAVLENVMLIEKIKEADQRKDEFLATLAHELRNPLAPISNALQIMRLMELPDARLTEVREIMQRQVQHMNRLVDDLLDVSRITRGKIKLKKENICLTDVVESAVEASRSLIEQSGHSLTVDLPDMTVPLLGDPTRLSQVFSNLLNNAAKYTDYGGRIFFTIRSDGGYVSAHIRDTGIGIPREMLPKIFDMFTQVDGSIERSRGGLGIGLKLVKELCTLHGGSVSVASEGPGRGSEFIVRLPVAKSVPERADCDQVSGGKKPWRILVIDDNKDSAKTYISMLELLGHETRFALDGPSGIETAESFMPEVVLLDIGLPGMDGYEVCRKMRADKRFCDTVFIAQTGWGQAEHRRRSREAGFDHHLVKPVDLQTLQKLLQEVSITPRNKGKKKPPAC